TLPNILITGTPGAGKSKLCEKLLERLEGDWEWQDVSKIAKENDCVTEYDEEFQCPVLDEDKLLDFMEPIMKKGGNIVEYHGCDFFPERWFQGVFVVRCNNTTLFDRLKERDYNDKKIASNVECEIFGTIYEEALESYKEDIITELKGETLKDLEEGCKKVKDFVRAWNRK
uniref:Adenylate kinase isoenzyme 6 homolog n=1 Tax=Megaselia scalaris TaxID=36166 RepID=T1GGZ5_MEGSC